MVTTSGTFPPDTVMGRALAKRVLTLVAERAELAPPTGARLDLTRPETAVLPAAIRAAAKAALDRGETHYTSRPGVPELRQAVAAAATAAGFPATAETTVITNGSAEALYIALQTALQPGDRAIVVEPFRPELRQMIEFIGAEVVPFPTSAGDRFVPTASDLPAAAAKVLLIASPSPITGIAIPPDTLRDLIAAAVEHDMFVILDRSLETARYDGEPTIFPDPSLGAEVLTTGSFSTGHGLGGWRVGYFTAPNQRMKQLRELKQAMSICTTAVSQFAALQALEQSDTWLHERQTVAVNRRNRAVSILGSAGLATVEADAFPPLLIDTRDTGQDDREIAANLARDAGILVEPGSRFGTATSGYLRLNLLAPESVLTEGLQKLTDAPATGGKA